MTDISDGNRSTQGTAGSAGEPDRLWTVEEVAVYLRLKPDTIRAMARRGLFHPIKVGNRWRFKKSEVIGQFPDK
jgi:excisionase family DNA binding protein